MAPGCIAVLAAGLGSRFGGPISKLAQEVDGEKIMMRSLRAAAGVGSIEWKLVVVSSHTPEMAIPEDFLPLYNASPEKGLASSLALAVEFANVHNLDYLVVGLADQPLIGTESWERVVAAETGGVAVATYGGKRANPVKIVRSVFELLPRDGDLGARAIFDKVIVNEASCRGDPIDVDTEADLEAVRLLKGRYLGD